MKNFVTPIAAMFLVAASMAALAVGKNDPKVTIELGSPAPAITVGGWVKGTPVTQFDPNKIYVVEFWATWCGPCKESIPHLTEMAKKFAGKVDFSGVSVWEQQKDDTDTSYVQTVKDFVTQMGDKMDYNVAYDTADKVMAKTWMAAAGQNGIPAAFVIKDSHVIWIGHPMTLEEPLTKIVDGTYDMKAAAAKLKEQQEEAAQEQALMADIGTLSQKVNTPESVVNGFARFRTKYPTQGDTLDNYEAMTLVGLKDGVGVKFLKKNKAKYPTVALSASEGLQQQGKNEEAIALASWFIESQKKATAMQKVEAYYVVANANAKLKKKDAALKAVDAGLAVCAKLGDEDRAGVTSVFQSLKDSLTKK